VCLLDAEAGGWLDKMVGQQDESEGSPEAPVVLPNVSEAVSR